MLALPVGRIAATWPTDGMIAAFTGSRLAQELQMWRGYIRAQSSSGATLTSSIWRRIRMGTAGLEDAEVVSRRPMKRGREGVMAGLLH